jgi:methionyl-tRNA formyltransferase
MTLLVGFAGTPEFAQRALEAIAGAGFTIPLVLTRPDKPKGRGLALTASPVKAWAIAKGLPVLQPATLKTSEGREEALACPLDVLVVAAYGLILPPAVLAWPRFGCLNIHASLLPRWRGAAPIQRAIEAGDASTGVTIMQMDEGLDTGPTIARVAVPIDPRDTGGRLLDRLADAGAALIVDVLGRLDRERRLPAVPQPADGATYAARIADRDARIDWARDAQAIDRQVRAFDPMPGAYTTLGGTVVKVWHAEPTPTPSTAPPGTVLAARPAGIDVACGVGALRILELQRAGGRRVPASALVAGRFVAAGARFVAPAA